MSAMVQQIDRYSIINAIVVDEDIAKEELPKLLACANLSQHLYTGIIDGKLICVYGLAPPCLLSESAYLWLYVTPSLKEHIFTFVRHSQIIVEEMLTQYPYIIGDVAAGNDKAIRWLKWLGAQFGQPNGIKIPFEIRKRYG